MKIDGRQIAQNILDSLKIQVNQLKEKGVTPTLAVILMGDDRSSEAYVKQKEIKAKDIGAEVKIFRFDVNVSKQEIESLVRRLDGDKSIHGIILQRPAPKQIDADILEELISPKKEVDGFGTGSLYPVPVAEAVWRMLSTVLPNNEIHSKNFVVLGKGETAGMPIINCLRTKGIEPKIIDSKTENRDMFLKNADVVISAVGKQNIIKAGELKTGVIAFGVGLSSDESGKLKGDFDDGEVEKIAKAYSPTPGGVGPVNVAVLMENLVKASGSS